MTQNILNTDVKQFIEELQSLLNSIPSMAGAASKLNDRARKNLKIELQEIIKELDDFLCQLDPISQPNYVFDPSDPHIIGRLIARTLLEQQRTALGKLEKFYGSGVYAVYYCGKFDAYSSISKTEIPIYVGKVDPKVPGAQTPEEQGIKLYDRLVKDHAKNIEKAQNLDLADFECRFLVVKSAWQNTAESYLIDWFKPVWNNEIKICYGFGKHGDKKETRDNTKSPWDTIHPGRSWAADHKPYSLSAAEIIQQIQNHYAQNLQSIQNAMSAP